MIRVEEVPLCVNPLTVVEKVNTETLQNKNRLVTDQCRYVNLFAELKTVKLDTLDFSEPFLQQNDYMMCFDLESIYHHVHLHPDFYKYFVFQIKDETGSLQYFVFTVLMFGCNYAVYLTDKPIKPIKSFLQENNLHIGVYIDDG